MRTRDVLVGAAVTVAAGYAIGDWLARVTLSGERTEGEQLHSHPVPTPAVTAPLLPGRAPAVDAVPAAYLRPAASAPEQVGG